MKVAAFQHVAQVQWIAQAHVGIAIAIAGVKLDGQALLRCMAECKVEQEIDERLLSNAQFIVSYSQTSFAKCSDSLVFAALHDLQAATIGHDAFQPAIAVCS